MKKFTIEYIDKIRVAYSEFAGENAASKSNGKLIDLFFKVAQDTYKRESGESVIDEKKYYSWMFATQFHLPPNIRWLGVRKAPINSFGPATEYEFWMAFGKRVHLPIDIPAKDVQPGLYASIFVDFKDTKLFDSIRIEMAWNSLIDLVKNENIEIDNRNYIEEHVQIPNDGGWQTMKLMLPIKESTLPMSMKNGLIYIKP